MSFIAKQNYGICRFVVPGEKKHIFVGKQPLRPNSGLKCQNSQCFYVHKPKVWFKAKENENC